MLRRFVGVFKVGIALLLFGIVSFALLVRYVNSVEQETVTMQKFVTTDDGYFVTYNLTVQKRTGMTFEEQDSVVAFLHDWIDTHCSATAAISRSELATALNSAQSLARFSTENDSLYILHRIKFQIQSVAE